MIKLMIVFLTTWLSLAQQPSAGNSGRQGQDIQHKYISAIIVGRVFSRKG